MNRRPFLVGTCATAVAWLAGCSTSEDERTLNGSVRPVDSPKDLPPPLSCERNDIRRHSQQYDTPPHWGTAEEFELRIENTAFDRGETAQITLTNTSDEPATTGKKNQVRIEVYTEAGWQDVRVWLSSVGGGYQSIGIEHQPGEGYEWTLTLTEDGITGISRDGMAVCPGLVSGRYRFVYMSDPPVAVGFDLDTDV